MGIRRQQTAALGIKHDWVDPDATIALSALSAMITLQDRGYAMIH